MSTLTEIEEAIGQLPPQQRSEIRRWMDAQMQRAAMLPGRVDWSQSAAVTRRRAPETRLDAAVVMSALSAVRE